MSYIHYNANPANNYVDDCTIRAISTLTGRPWRGRATGVSIWRGCCETITIRNTSDQPIQMQNANIVFSRPDLTVTY